MADSQNPEASIALMNPLDAIKKSPPNVWLSSLYSFEPEKWGFLGFTEEWMRRSFVRRSTSGVLVVLYGASRSSPQDRRKIIGVQQQSHQCVYAREFMSEDDWNKKQSDSDGKKRWNYGVRTLRAWRVSRESQIDVSRFASITYKPARGQPIGAQGMPLTSDEAHRILDLDLYEVEVYGQPEMGFSAFGAAENVLTPSRPGPVSQSPHMVCEAEGRKHLYILNLKGDADAFLCEPAHGRLIVKVGFSASPNYRCRYFNHTLPKGAFRWTIHKSTFAEDRAPFPCSGHALEGEKAMKDLLEKSGKSLGGEFFLAGSDEIEVAWRRGLAVAENWRPK